MRASRVRSVGLAALSLSVVWVSLSAIGCGRAESDWSRFRGPNGSGISDATGIPLEFGTEANLVWRLPLPVGYSSPILWEDRIYLTGLRDETLLTIAIDRERGEVLWEREAPGVATRPPDPRNHPASPSAAVEDDAIYVFFADFGLLAYDASGDERWRVPLGPFDNIYGMGASPIIVGDLVVLVCDQSLDSYVMAVDKRTGELRSKTPRPEATSGHSTPVLWRTLEGEDQILVPGSFLLTAYAAETGERRWWVRGLSFEMKSTPAIAEGVLFANGYGAPQNDPGNKVVVPPADEIWPTADADGNGLLSDAELPPSAPRFWFGVGDLDKSGELTKEEYAYYRAALDSENGLLAIRLGGEGDMTEAAVKWKYQRSIPQLPSPIVYGGVLYMVNDAGILTSLDPETGEVIKQGRLMGAMGSYYSSPVAADGHLFFTSEAGVVSVLPPDGSLEALHYNDLAEEAYATPAFADGRIYVRTVEALYAFGS
jgi:outer membrane protein assembly factor BamB